jgi:hypothetical protein
MTKTGAGRGVDQKFVGYDAAAEYLDMNKNTLSAYCSKGYGPAEHARQIESGYARPVFLGSELDRWKANRPGQGARTDRMHTGTGLPCAPCEGVCTVDLPA